MDLQITDQHRAQVEEFRQKHKTALLTLLFTDIVGSTKIKQQLGDRDGVAVMGNHHALVREILAGFPEGEEISTAGDSFFIVFVKPSDAVKFALTLQSRLRAEAKETSHPVLDRIGIHLGEVVVQDEDGSGRPKDLFGIQVDTCARVMSLGDGDQIVMTRSVFDNARQVLKGQDIEGVGELSWMNHGPYVMKGVEDPLEVCEVGEEDLAVLSPPTNSEKAHRHVSAEGELVLGWRPALEQTVPGTEWVLEEKLGEGGFGEVWKARHRKLKQCRVFKFCFRADRVRSLTREVTLFRVLKEHVGEHPNIVRLHDVYFDEPPYYLVTEYVEGRDLTSWCEEQGGVENVPLETRLEIVAQAAEALQAAHDAGIIHRDIKPSNILIDGHGISPENIQVKLTDFGIGQITSKEALAGVTEAGFTQTMMVGDTASRSGTYLYMAPELIAGKPASIRSDIYSLGVVLYQLFISDLSRPLGMGWASNIHDPLIEDDITRCCTDSPQDRFSAAEQLAQSIHSLSDRREQLAEQEAARRRALRRRRLTMVTSILLGIITLLAIALGYGLRREKIQRRIAEREQYYSNLGFAGECIKNIRYDRARDLLKSCPPQYRNWEWGRYQFLCSQDLFTLNKHSNMVSSVAFSPDGKQIVTGSADGTVRLWNAETGQEITCFTVQSAEGDPAYFTAVAFSPDGKYIISESGLIVVWNVENGRETLRQSGYFSTMAISPDSKRIVVVNMVSNIETEGFMSGQTVYHEDSAAKVYDIEAGQVLFTLDKHTGPITSVEYSPDARHIVTASKDFTAKVWDAETGQEARSLEGHSNQVVFVGFSPDNQYIITGSNDNTAKVWDVDTGNAVKSLEGHSGPVIHAAFSPNGERIVTGSFDESAKVWNFKTGQEVISLEAHSSPVPYVAFSPDGKRVVTVTGIGDGKVKLWDAETGREIKSIEGQLMDITYVAFSPNGERMLSWGGDKTAKVWDFKTGQELISLEGHAAVIRSAAFSPDGKRIVTGSNDGTGKVWDMEKCQRVNVFDEYPSVENVVALSPTGEFMVTLGKGNTAKVWDAETGREVFCLEGHSDRISAVGFSPDGSRIATTSWDKTTKVWDAETGKELLSLVGQSASFYPPVFSRDGELVATMSGIDDGHVINIWNTKTGEEVNCLKGISNFTTFMVFSPDGTRLVTVNSGASNEFSDDTSADEEMIRDSVTGEEISSPGNEPDRLLTNEELGQLMDEFESEPSTGQDVTTSSGVSDMNVSDEKLPNEIKVWDSDTGAEIERQEIHSGNIISVVFSPDGKHIVTAHDENTTKVWDAENAQEVLSIEGHPTLLTSKAFSPDGKRIVMGCLDNIAKVWDTETYSELVSLKGHSAPVFFAVFSPDGKQIATASADDTIKVWDAETGQQVSTFEGHPDPLKFEAFSPDGKRLATMSLVEDGKGMIEDSETMVKIWASETGREISSCDNISGVLYSTLFSPDGERLITMSTGKKVQVWFDEGFIELNEINMVLWDTETGEKIKRLESHASVCLSVAVSPDGKRIVMGCQDNTVRVWDAETFSELFRLEGHSAPVLSMEFSPDGKEIATSSMDKTVKVWNAETGQEIANLEGHSANLVSVVFSPDGKRIVTESEDGVKKMYNANTGQEIATIEGGSGSLGSMAFTPDSKRFVTVRYGNSPEWFLGQFDESADEVKVWDVETGREVASLDGVSCMGVLVDVSVEGVSGMVVSVDFSPDGKRIITEDPSNAKQVWDITTGQAILDSGEHPGVFLSVVFSPDGKRIVTGYYGESEAKVWDAVTGRELLNLKGHSSDVQSVAFSPDGKRIVTGSADSTAKVWDAETGKEITTLKGHSVGVESVAFSPDGQRIVTGRGMGDGTVKVWDAETGREVVSLEGHTKSVDSLSFSPDGMRIIAEYQFSAPKVWSAFPWHEEDYPGDSSLTFEERLELYKREYWRMRLAVTKTGHLSDSKSSH